ncbi:hypothetical protein C488_19057 [Natrinema pellirubrum DSM 15624]|uniref:Uncharacterized protein n=2 Tax=Natrinema TaxID=88723 RepID=L0JFC3_NATP1|nr:MULTISPECIES: hypothetical protein [Natrinema]ELZ15885.1 hypothetical protein C478_04084 [Natrinema thermotolerans DSM 11552]AGB29999.1 hypothetical protein Natpe_0052 [Natrinema pellirubrum DSM 15624]ELY70308.1 hypothetical protein C488_19057 [Natrinema pellirubrum DSM 15624]QCC58878.1 hypothetical protein DVR14_09650 [Natrinema thermotolerans]WMT10038.1 hypothetical protein NP511_10510 [Natrinema thermotolerans]
MDGDAIHSDLADEIHSVCRTTVGDELRSITYFTEDDVEQLYLRSDLEQTADLIGFAEHERLGFHSQSAYRNTQLGEYEATIRMFENGFLSRVIRGPHGVWVTTDDMSIERFEELTSALASVLDEYADSVDAPTPDGTDAA